MHRPTNVIMTSMDAASGSRTQPNSSFCWPNVNQVKELTLRKSDDPSVVENATIAKTSAATCPAIASADAIMRRLLERPRITSATANGIAGISQRYSVIQLVMRPLIHARSQGAADC